MSGEQVIHPADTERRSADWAADGAGLSSVEAARRLAVYGPNVLRAHGVSLVAVLVRLLRSYLLLLLVGAAVVSAVLGDGTEALIIGVIIALSVT